MGTPSHMVMQDVSTHWKSAFHMVSRLLEQRWPATAALSDPAVTQRGTLFSQSSGLLLRNSARLMGHLKRQQCFWVVKTMLLSLHLLSCPKSQKVDTDPGFWDCTCPVIANWCDGTDHNKVGRTICVSTSGPKHCPPYCCVRSQM